MDPLIMAPRLLLDLAFRITHITDMVGAIPSIRSIRAVIGEGPGGRGASFLDPPRMPTEIVPSRSRICTTGPKRSDRKIPTMFTPIVTAISLGAPIKVNGRTGHQEVGKITPGL